MTFLRSCPVSAHPSIVQSLLGILSKGAPTIWRRSRGVCTSFRTSHRLLREAVFCVCPRHVGFSDSVPRQSSPNLNFAQEQCESFQTLGPFHPNIIKDSMLHWGA